MAKSDAVCTHYKPKKFGLTVVFCAAVNNKKSALFHRNRAGFFQNARNRVRISSSVSKTYLTADEIVGIIEKENIDIVSFDIFDTLLVRPSMMPSEIFFLLQEREKERYGIDFYKKLDFSTASLLCRVFSYRHPCVM